ncbi:MAG TPA: hypothetical protein VJ044_14100 [Candidatus Hodarchaeales archaeon]|nr:hypothetical protein [Candidatus Hodarchaeales archaeon]
MDVNFKFKISQIVTTKESYFVHQAIEARRDPKDAWMKKESIPLTLQVRSRLMEECMGGIQLHYLCSYYMPNGYRVDRFSEDLLMPHPDAVSKSV